MVFQQCNSFLNSSSTITKSWNFFHCNLTMKRLWNEVSCCLRAGRKIHKSFYWISSWWWCPKSAYTITQYCLYVEWPKQSTTLLNSSCLWRCVSPQVPWKIIYLSLYVNMRLSLHCYYMLVCFFVTINRTLEAAQWRKQKSLPE